MDLIIFNSIKKKIFRVTKRSLIYRRELESQDSVQPVKTKFL